MATAQATPKARKAQTAQQRAAATAAMQAGRPKGPDHLTPSQRMLIAFFASHSVDGEPVAMTKREVATSLGRCEKTIDRIVSDLRRRDLLEAIPRHLENGGQVSNAYRPTELAREKYPALFAQSARSRAGGRGQN